MRIEISSSGFGGAAISELQGNLNTYIGDAESVFASFKTIKESTARLNGGAGSLQGALENIDSRARTEESKIQDAKVIQNKVNEFVSLAVRVDECVSERIKCNKEELYRVNPWLKPTTSIEEEVPWYEQAWNWLCGTGEVIADGAKNVWNWVSDTAVKVWNGIIEIYQEHKELLWKIAGTALIVAGVALTIVAIISTGGTALAGLVPLLTAIGFAESTAATISAAVAITAIVSSIGSGVMNIIDLWKEIDNELFTGIQSTLAVISFATSFVYAIGSTISKHIVKSIGKPNQIHHYATNKNSTYTKQFEAITQKYGLNLDDTWNKELLPHQGKHPSVYHEYVLDLMEQIDQIAQGDKKVFLQLYEELVKDTIRKNPKMLYSEYWINAEKSILTGENENIIRKIFNYFGGGK